MKYYEKPVVGIYKITHVETGKAYIGQSVNIFKRWKEHSNFAQAKKRWQTIKHALNKHGLSAFTFEVLEECDKEALNNKEIYWIKHFDTISPNGYNLTSGGDNPPPSEKGRGAGRKLTDEHKVAVSKALKEANIKRSDETKQKMGKAKYKACVINEIEYESVEHAAKTLNKNKKTLAKYLRGAGKWPDGLSGYYK
jgi:group I intron endonuclease